MLKSAILYIFLFFSFISFSQDWSENLPKNKTENQLTFFDYQNAFYSYWSKYNVINGYYLENGVRKKAIGWKQFKRWEYEMKSQINPVTGEFPSQTAYEIQQKFQQNNPHKKSTNAANWTQLGSNSATGGYHGIGKVLCVAFHPTDNNTYWVGTGGGGLWVTTNNALTWTCLTDNIGRLPISDIVIPSDYATSNTIYIATGDRDTGWTFSSSGVLKSTDGGLTWSSTGLTYALSSYKNINRLVISPTNNQVILAATTSGIYKTTNGGTTWNTLVTATAFMDLKYKPGDFNTLYGSTKTGKIYTSTDGGTTWNITYNNANGKRVELAISPNQPTWVYAIVAGRPNGAAASVSTGGLYGIYKSTDSGATFSLVLDGINLNMMGYAADGQDFGSGQGFANITIAASPTNANIVIAGGVNAWKSTDGGSTWNIINHWSTSGAGYQVVHADKHAHNYRSNGDLFEGNDGGMYFSSNNGSSWTDKSNGLGIGQLYRLGISKTDKNQTITGLQDNGTKLYSSATWSDVKGGDGMECIIDFTNANIQYGTYVEGQISRTLNHWGSSVHVEPTVGGTAVTGSWVTPYIMDPTNNLILYAGYDDVWKTTNQGTSWTQISNFGLTSGTYLESIAIANSNTQYLYTATATQIFKTTNGGTSWTDITGTLPVSTAVGGNNITYIAVKNDDPNTLWVTFSSYNTNRVFESINGGTTWTNISTGLPSLPIHTIVQNNQVTSEVELFVGTELGVYFKKGTANWVAYNTGLPNVKVNELEIFYDLTDATLSRLRAATYGRGLWESTIAIASLTAPVAGTANSNATICSGLTSNLTLTGSTGTIQWQQSTTNAGPWVNVSSGTGATTTAYTTGVLSSTTYFKALVSQAGFSDVSSNVITITVTPSVTPSVSISLTTGSNPMCNGTTPTFTATPTNGGTTPTYQWKINNVNQVGNSSTFSPSSLVNGNSITCVITSNATCASPTTSVASNSILMTVNPNVTPTVSIALTTGSNPMCSGTTPTFTATPTNGGTTPTYQWKINNINQVGNSSTFSPSSLVNGNSITCVITSNATCASPSTSVASNSVLMTINPTVIPSVSISQTVGTNPICSGTTPTFTATPINGGITPIYQWKINNVNQVGNSPTFSPSSLVNGDAITCVITSNATCASPTISMASTPITISVNPNITPSVAISLTSGSNPICSGTTPTFTASPTNGGLNPIYQWFINNTAQVGNSSSFSPNSLINGDAISCIITSNATCASPTISLASNSIVMNVNPTVTPSVAISQTIGTNPMCNGTTPTFTATPTNGGTMPIYQWFINGSVQIGNSVTFSPSSLVNGDIITCILTSNANYANPSNSLVSNPLTMQVSNSLTPSVSISLTSGSNPMCSGASTTFSAIPSNGGNNPTYQWFVNGIDQLNNNVNFTSTTLVDQDIVTCVLTSNAACVTSFVSLPSNGITIQVSLSLTPSVLITQSVGSNPICSGIIPSYTAIPTNGGTMPIYQWFINGTIQAGNSTTFSPSSIVNGDAITCIITSNSSCASPTTSLASNAISMIVNTTVTPSVAITQTVGANSMCSGFTPTFTASPTNGGTTPIYQWKINNINQIGNSATFSPSTLQNGDAISCVITSNATCASPTISLASNSISMTVNPTVIPSVSITQTVGTNPSCSGTTPTFTANPTNGGTTPIYQWKINNVNQIGNSATFSPSSLVNGDAISCEITSNATCASPSISSPSTPITMTINPNVTPSVSITLTTGSNPMCSGITPTFTATPTNGGTTPIYQWFLNGIDQVLNSTTFSPSALVNGDAITCIITSNASCANPTTSLTSNSIVMTINPSVIPSVVITQTVGTNPMCSGITPTYTATPTNGGTTPIYQWKINNINQVGNSATFSPTSLVNGDAITCEITSNATCANPLNSHTSSSINMNLIPSVTPSVVITQTIGTNPLCSGSLATFMASCTNGGTFPTYKWFIDGIDQNNNNQFFTPNTITDGQIITCSILSDAVCASPINSPLSNPINIKVNQIVTPQIQIAEINNLNSFCNGDYATFKTTTLNEGTNPIYNWKIDNILQSEVSTTFITNKILDGQKVTCELISNAFCTTNTNVTSNIILINVKNKIDKPLADSKIEYCINQNINDIVIPIVNQLSNYNWFSDSLLLNKINSGPTFTPSKNIGNKLYYVIEEKDGCKSEKSKIDITIKLCDFTFPTAFTPDGDNTNDTWELKNIEVFFPNNSIYIYSRQGELMFESTIENYSKNPWDGKLDGKELPVSSYYFIIKNKDNKAISGIVSIITNK